MSISSDYDNRRDSYQYQEAELAMDRLNGASPHNFHVSFAKPREPRPDSSCNSNFQFGFQPGRKTHEISESRSPKNNQNAQTPNRQSFKNISLPIKGNPACNFYPCPNDAHFKCPDCGANYCREFCRNQDWKRHREEDCVPKQPLLQETIILDDRGGRSTQQEMQQHCSTSAAMQPPCVSVANKKLSRNEESPLCLNDPYDLKGICDLSIDPLSRIGLQKPNEHRLTNGDATSSQFQDTIPCIDDYIRSKNMSLTKPDNAATESSVDFKDSVEVGNHPNGNDRGFRGRGGHHRPNLRKVVNDPENKTSKFSHGSLDEKAVTSQTIKKNVTSNIRLEEQTVPSTCRVKPADQIRSIPPPNFKISAKTEVDVLFVRNPHYITIRPVSMNDEYKKVLRHLQNVGNRKKIEGECKVGAAYALYYENVWYRCQVTRIFESEPEFVVAHLVDIGKSLKKYQKDLFVLDDAILGVPALSMAVMLDVSERSSVGWNKKVVELLRQLTETSPDLQLFVTETGKDTSGQPIVNMIDNNGEDIVGLMLELSSMHGKEESKALTTGLSNHHQLPNQSTPNLRRPNCEATTESEPATQKTYFLPSPHGKDGAKYMFDQAKYVQLPIEEINVVVLHIEGPGEFYIIPEDNILMRELSGHEEKISTFYVNNEGIAYNPELGEVVLATFEGSWHRAVSLGIAETASYHLQFVDYGNYSLNSSKDIRRMEDQFMHLPFVACCVALEKFENKNPTDQETMEFKEKLPINSSVKVKVLKVDGDYRYTVDIPSLGF